MPTVRKRVLLIVIPIYEQKGYTCPKISKGVVDFDHASSAIGRYILSRSCSLLNIPTILPPALA